MNNTTTEVSADLFANENNNARLSETAFANLEGAHNENSFINVICLTGLADLFYKLAHYFQSTSKLPNVPSAFLDFGVSVHQAVASGPIQIEIKNDDFEPCNIAIVTEVFAQHSLPAAEPIGGSTNFYLPNNEATAESCARVAESMYSRAAALYREASTLENR